MSLQREIGFIQTLSMTSVRVGNLIIPADSVENLLTRYTRQIFLVNDFPEHPYSICGSGTAVNFNGSHFVFCCQHQFKNFNPDQVAVICRRDKNYLIHGSNLRIPKVDDSNSDEDYIDTCGFNFNLEGYDLENLSSEFFNLNDDNLWPNFAKDKFIVIGYPTYEQNINSLEGIQARVVIVSGRYNGSSQAQFVHKILLERSRKFDCDGLSGGAIFYLGEKHGYYFIGLAGMIVRGSAKSEEIYFIEAQLLKYFCEQAKI